MMTRRKVKYSIRIEYRHKFIAKCFQFVVRWIWKYGTYMERQFISWINTATVLELFAKHRVKFSMKVSFIRLPLIAFSSVNFCIHTNKWIKRVNTIHGGIFHNMFICISMNFYWIFPNCSLHTVIYLHNSRCVQR